MLEVGGLFFDFEAVRTDLTEMFRAGGFEDVDCLAQELSTQWPPKDGTPQKLEQALESYSL